MNARHLPQFKFTLLATVCALAASAAQAQSVVGIISAVNAGTFTNNGSATINGTAKVTGLLTTNGISNTGNITNTGDIQTTSLSTNTIQGVGNTTRISLSDGAVSFGNNRGEPVKVTGVANGRGDFDAVNMRQFANAIAATTAMANIPGVDLNKFKSFGMGIGSYQGKTAMAIGGSYRFSNNGVMRASVSTPLNGGHEPSTVGVGAGWSW